MKKIAYAMPDGAVAVIHPIDGARLALSLTLADGTVLTSEVPVSVDSFRRTWPIEGASPQWAETEDEFLRRIIDSTVPSGATGVMIIEESCVPSDRSFRAAWIMGPAGIEHDMEKCRAIHRDRLRAMRSPKLAQLDVDYQRADENADTAKKRETAQKKQVLRDVTNHPAIDAARTPEELKAAVPEALA